MNRQLTTDELKDFLSVVDRPKPMTRREKLYRFVELLEKASRRPFMIFHNLECLTDAQLRYVRHECSAFTLAANDPVLSAAGLKEDNALAMMKFFELSKAELHAFSCDCGGQISNADMARRVAAMAVRG